MATVFDVAVYILAKKGPMTAMKLQKLVYYAQAWSLVWDEKPLFRHEIQAWANGPVAPALYQAHSGQYKVAARDLLEGDRTALAREQQETVDAVLGYYADKSSQWLSELTHAEPPWKDARKGLEPGQRGSVVIRHADMDLYYGSLV